MKHLITLAFIFFVFKPISSQDLNTNSDFDLVSSLELVLKNHKLIEASKIDSKAAKFRVKQSKGAYYPSLDVTVNVIFCKFFHLAALVFLKGQVVCHRYFRRPPFFLSEVIPDHSYVHLCLQTTQSP